MRGTYVNGREKYFSQSYYDVEGDELQVIPFAFLRINVSDWCWLWFQCPADENHQSDGE